MKKILNNNINKETGNWLVEDYLVFLENIVRPYNEKMNYTLGGIKINQSKNNKFNVN